MSDKFICNKCGKEMDAGYFYCEECHRIHKAKRKELVQDKLIIQKESEVSDGDVS